MIPDKNNISLFRTEPDRAWQALLDLSDNLPKPKMRSTVVQRYLVHKNLHLLRAGLVQSQEQVQGYQGRPGIVSDWQCSRSMVERSYF